MLIHSRRPGLAHICICFHRPHYVEQCKGSKDATHQTEGSVYKTDSLWTKPGAWSVQQFLLTLTFLSGSISHSLLRPRRPLKAVMSAGGEDWSSSKTSSSEEFSVEGLPIPIPSTGDHVRTLLFNCSSFCLCINIPLVRMDCDLRDFFYIYCKISASLRTIGRFLVLPSVDSFLQGGQFVFFSF